MRAIAIDDRTSFLETNSFKFVQDHSIISGDKIPAGYMADWEKRHLLVMTKIIESLSPGQKESDWQSVLLLSEGKNKNNDDFVEAHVFEGFTAKTIESVTQVPGKKLNRIQEIQKDFLLTKIAKAS
jgi:hypothetical protein